MDAYSSPVVEPRHQNAAESRINLPSHGPRNYKRFRRNDTFSLHVPRHIRSLQNARVAWQSASYVSRAAVRSAAAQTARAALAFENETAGVIHAN